MTDLLLLYTCDLGGEIEQLQRLHTFLRQIEREAAPARVLRLDLGGFCAPGVWHCAATDNRSTLLVLDAMGFAAVHVEGQISETARARLAENYLGLALVDAAHPHPVDDLLLLAADESQGAARLEIDLRPAETTTFDGRRLRLARTSCGQVGECQLSLGAGILTLEAVAVHTVPPATPPDPIITAAVEFVLAEARRYQGRRPTSI